MIAFSPRYLGVFAVLAALLSTPTFGFIPVGKICQKIEVIAEDITDACKIRSLSGGGSVCVNPGTVCLNRISGGGDFGPQIELGTCTTVIVNKTSGERQCRCVSAGLVIQVAMIDSLLDGVLTAKQFPAFAETAGMSAACSQLAVVLTSIDRTARDLEEAPCLDILTLDVTRKLDKIITHVPPLEGFASQCGLTFDASAVNDCVLFKKSQVINDLSGPPIFGIE